jgi:chitin synthase
MPVTHVISSQFANVHDVSWGTKGDNKVSTDLGVVATGKNKNEVEVAVPTAETDINAAYEDAIHVLNTKPPKSDPKPDIATDQEDYYKTFRTKYVISCFPIFPCYC